MGYITRSRMTRDRLAAAKELKKLVYFSNIVVAPMLDDLKVLPYPPIDCMPQSHLCFCMLDLMFNCSVGSVCSSNLVND